MSRAAFISCGGDVFLILMMFHFFETVWQDEVDKLYICYNGIDDMRIVNYVEEIVRKNPKVVFIFSETPLSFGLPINRCLQACSEDLILLLEDDGFIYDKGIVDKCFKRIESGEADIVGSPRFSCSFEWSALMKKKLGVKTWGTEGDIGPNFWPNFFFCKRSDLLKTDLNFAPVNFPQGTYVPLLDYVAGKEGLVGDTFVWASVQLRMMGLRVFEVPQFKASPLEHDEYMKGEGKWKARFGWIHAGSLSVFWNGMRIDKFMPPPPNDFLTQEYETRVAFWTIAANLKPYDEIKDIKDKYISQLKKTVNYYGMKQDRIDKKLLIYKKLLNIW